MSGIRFGVTRLIAVGLVAVFGSACASGGPNPWICAAAAGALGAGGGAVIGAKSTRGHDGDEAAIGGGIGLVAGGALGYLVCALMQKEEAPPPAKAAPAPPPAPKAEKIVLRGVNFDFDKATIRPDAKVILDEAASQLSKNPDVRVSVEGHTDSVGKDAYNQKLSERRAASVKSYLVGKGVSDSRLSSVGYGESKPVSSNDTKDGRALNRRVELLVR